MWHEKKLLYNLLLLNYFLKRTCCEPYGREIFTQEYVYVSAIFNLFSHNIKYVVSLLESFDTVSSCYHVDTFRLRLRQILRCDSVLMEDWGQFHHIVGYTCN